MSNESRTPATSTIPGPLPFTHSKLGVAETLKGFMNNAAWLVGFTLEKAPSYTVDWRKRHNLMETKPPQDTPEDRADWFRTILGTSLAYGMDLPTSSNPSPDELVWAVARWAHGALLHIQGLEQAHQRAISEWAASDLKRQQEYETLLLALGEEQQRAAGLEGRLVDVERERVNETARADRAVGLLADERALYGTTVAAMTQEIARAQEQRDAETDRVKRAESERDAWKTSATSSQDALSMLRTALRIPHDVAEGDVEPVQRHELIRR